MTIPLSRIDGINALLERRKAAVGRVERYAKLAGIAVFFSDNGTTESEPVPDGWVEDLRNTLIDHCEREIRAIDADLVALGVDPGA